LLSSRRNVALTILIVGVYAFCFSAIKFGLEFAPPLRFAALRSALAGAALLGFLSVSRRRVLPPHRLWGGTVTLGLVGTSLAYAAMFMSPGRTGAGIASVLGNTGPIITIVLAAAFLDERITSPKSWSLLLGMVGVSLIAWPAISDPTRPDAAGFLLPLASAASTAGATVLLKRLRVGDAIAQVAAWQLVIGAVPLAVASAIFERGVHIEWGGSFVAVLLFLALIGTAFALWLWYWLVQREDVGKLSLFFFLVPPLGLALAASIFGERISLVEGAGVAVTVAALAVLLSASRSVGSAAGAATTSGGGGLS